MNLLEMEPVFLALSHFFPIILGRQVMEKSDSPAMRYINCQDGLRSIPAYKCSWMLLVAQSMGVVLRAFYF